MLVSRKLRRKIVNQGHTDDRESHPSKQETLEGLASVLPPSGDPDGEES